jgi:hypothetical protein
MLRTEGQSGRNSGNCLAWNEVLKHEGISLPPRCQVQVFINAFDVAIPFDRPHPLSIVGNSNQEIRQYIPSDKPPVFTPGGNTFITKNKLGGVVLKKDIAGIADVLVGGWHSPDENDTKKLQLRPLPLFINISQLKKLYRKE